MDCRALALIVASGALLGTVGCLVPNPHLVEDETGSDDDLGTDESSTGTEESSSEGSSSEDTETSSEGESSSDETDSETDAVDTCMNDELDPDETDVDCGGACPPCGDGLDCDGPEDCESGVCKEGVCQQPNCTDEVQNGDEADVDCGGDCVFCEGQAFASLDDLAGPAARAQAVLFNDGAFAVSFTDTTTDTTYLRWFDADGSPDGDSEEVDPGLDDVTSIYTRLGRSSDAEGVATLMAGTNQMGTPRLRLNRVTPLNQFNGELVVDPTLTTEFDLVQGDGSNVAVVWVEDDEVKLRWWEFSNGAGGWEGVSDIPVDPDHMSVTGADPVITRNAAGVLAITWRRCDPDCTLVARRYDDGWLDDEPAELGAPEFGEVAIALGDDNRAMVVWLESEFLTATPWAQVLDQDFSPGTPWPLAGEYASGSRPQLDVAALSDGSFAVAWVESSVDGHVRLRRFVDTETPKFPGVTDEAPWPSLESPGSVALAADNERLLVVWTALDGQYQTQGQMLRY